MNRDDLERSLCELPGFSSKSLDLAASLIDGYGLRALAPRAAPLLSLQMAFFFWIDDRFDEGRAEAHAAEETIDSLFDARPATGAEARGFAAIEQALFASRPAPAQRARWRASAAAIVEAMSAESAITPRTTLLEYALIATPTATITHLFATLAWIEDLRFDDRATAALVRRLALHARLHNDLRSVRRDEREGSLANAVLIAAAQHGIDAARATVERTLAQLEASIAVDLDEARAHPLVRGVAPKMLATHEAFYQRFAERYAAAAH
jgi:hypothetical protein